MNKFLYFAQSTTDAIMVNVNHLSMIDVVDADTVQFYFRSNDAVDFSGSVLVDITSGKCKEFLKAIGKPIVNTRRTVLVIADDAGGEYFATTDASGTAVAATNCGTIALS